MKKLFFISTALMLSVLPVNIAAEEQVPLRAKIITTGGVQNQPSKSPVFIPVVYIDNNVLSFGNELEDCTVQLLDEDENIVFSHFIDENETTVTFPCTLTGTYELQIVRGNITFYAYIEL